MITINNFWSWFQPKPKARPSKDALVKQALEYFAAHADEIDNATIVGDDFSYTVSITRSVRKRKVKA